MNRRPVTHHRRDSGQALVEFSLAIMVFLVMVLALFDLGRGVYMYNGVSEAAREIARVTAVHPGVTLGASTETADRIAVQRALVPGLGDAQLRMRHRHRRRQPQRPVHQRRLRPGHDRRDLHPHLPARPGWTHHPHGLERGATPMSTRPVMRILSKAAVPSAGAISSTHRAERERGQILVLFALGAVAMIAMVGLVLDGGSTFAQRRDQQNGADLAALAGANAYLNSYVDTGSIGTATAAARSAALAAATTNGYPHGGDIAVTATVNLLSAGAEVKVDITKPHENSFARVMGFERWDVGVTATAETGAIDTGVGAAPWIMNINAFRGNGTPEVRQGQPDRLRRGQRRLPGQRRGPRLDRLQRQQQRQHQRGATGSSAGSNVVTATVGFDQYIGQHNQGNHTALYPTVNSYLAGKDVPIPIVGPCPAGSPNPDGCFKGWAMFHVISASGGSDKTITGYFLTNFIRQPLTVGECTAAMQAAGTCGRIPESVFGAYAVRLSN